MSAISRALFASLFLATSAHAASDDPAFVESIYFPNPSFLQVTGMAWAPDGSGRLFLIRKDGVVSIVQNGALLPQPFAFLTPVYTNSECGLIGITFDHDFIDNGRVYFFVTVSASEQQIIRYTAMGNVGVDRTVLVTGLDTVGANHDGGGIDIGADGKLYWAIGDNGNGRGVNNDLTRTASKIGRANLDGTPVLDNPFFDGAGPNNDYIWARGHRNPFTIAFQRRTGRLWVNDVGTGYEKIFRPLAGDHAGYNAYEIDQPAGFTRPVIWYATNGSRSRNLAAAAANGAVRVGNVATFTNTGTEHYFHVGQRVTISGVADASFNVSRAVVTSVPSPSTFTIAQVGPDATSGGGTAATDNIGGSITGGTFYESTGAPAGYRGDYFFGDYNSGRIMRAQLGPNNEVISVDRFASSVSQAIDLDVGPDGNLYAVQIDGLVRRYQAVVPGALVVTPLALWMGDGGQGRFTVRLGSAPAANVTVSVARTGGSNDVTVTGGAQLVFTPANWAVPQAVSLAAAADADTTNDVAAITVSAPGLGSEQVDVTVVEDDVPSIVVSSTALTVAEGGQGSFGVSLSASPGGPRVVSIARESGDADVGVTVATLTFDANNFAVPQQVTVTAAQDGDAADDQAIVAVQAAGYEPRRVTVTVDDDDATALAITSAPDTTAVAGVSYAYDVNTNSAGAVTYTLSVSPAGMTIDGASGLISWTPTMPATVNVTVVASNGVPPDATQSFQIVVTADQPPTAVLTRPTAGEVVSGANAEFYGDGVDDVGTVRAEFSVDGVVRSVDTTAGGHYHFGGTHNLWNTTVLADGVHVVRMTVFDGAGQSGFAEVTVTVRNAQPDAGVVGMDAAGVVDSGVRDAGVVDSGVRDAAAAPDAMAPDAAPRDAAAPDAAAPDAMAPDAMAPDAAPRDASAPDAAPRDASAPDAVVVVNDDASAANDDATAVNDDATAANDDATAANDDASAASDDASAVNDDASAANDDATAASDAAPTSDDAASASDDAATASPDAASTADASAPRDAGSAIVADAGVLEPDTSSCGCGATPTSGAPTWILGLIACATLGRRRRGARAA